MGTIPDLPEACAIVGGGVIAVEYATVLASLGVEVYLLCKDEVGTGLQFSFNVLCCAFFVLRCSDKIRVICTSWFVWGLGVSSPGQSERLTKI